MVHWMPPYPYSHLRMPCTSPLPFPAPPCLSHRVVLRNGKVLDGMDLILSVAEGSCAKWSVHWMVDGHVAGHGPTEGPAGGPAVHMQMPPGLGEGEEGAQGEGQAGGVGEGAAAGAGPVLPPPALCISFHRKTPEGQDNLHSHVLADLD